MDNINPNVPQTIAKSQIDELINQFRSVFEDVLETLANIVFPDTVDRPLRKRDTIMLQPSAFVTWSSQYFDTIDRWVASPSFPVFACLFQSALVTFDVNAATNTAFARLQHIVSLGNSRANDTATADSIAANDLAKIQSSIQSTITKLRGPFQCALNSPSSILTVSTVVIGATSTQFIIGSTKAAQTSSGFTVITKTEGTVTTTVTEPCIITYTPAGTSTIYYGGTTTILTEVCKECVGSPVVSASMRTISTATANVNPTASAGNTTPKVTEICNDCTGTPVVPASMRTMSTVTTKGSPIASASSPTTINTSASTSSGVLQANAGSTTIKLNAKFLVGVLVACLFL